MERLLVAQTGFLGDVVLTTPLLATLRRELSLESLTVLTTPQARPLVENHPAVDQVLVDAKHDQERGFLGMMRTARRLRQQAFTLAVAPHKSLRTALLLTLASIPRRVGFRQSPGRFFYNQTAQRDANRHEVERILCIMRVFGREPEECERRPHVAYSARAQANAHVLLRETQIAETEPVFVLCPGSVWYTKRWTIEGYAALVRSLEQHYGRVVLCGGPDDVGVVQAVQERAGERVANLAGRADLQTFMALLDRAQMVISNDSAPMHIAVARHIPVVAIFCATTPSLGYGPYSDNAVVVEEKELFCRPCGRHGSRSCPRGTEECMKQVSPNDVLSGVDQLLKQTATQTTTSMGHER
jgi:heptosyltransferase-2